MTQIKIFHSNGEQNKVLNLRKYHIMRSRLCLKSHTVHYYYYSSSSNHHDNSQTSNAYKKCVYKIKCIDEGKNFFTQTIYSICSQITQQHTPPFNKLTAKKDFGLIFYICYFILFILVLEIPPPSVILCFISPRDSAFNIVQQPHGAIILPSMC